MSKTLDLARDLVRILEEAERKNQVQLFTMQPGEIIVSNGHRYMILKQMDGQTKIQSVNLMMEKVKFDSESVDYTVSDIKKKIDTDLLPIFETDFGAGNIIEHDADLTTVDMQKNFGACRCKVRPITFDEVREFNDLLAKDLPSWYWTCTPWSTEKRGWSRSVAVVSPSGRIDSNYCDCSDGVRPICILKSNIFVSRGE